MFEKLKAYYKNSPKRIGLTISFIHVLFLALAIVFLYFTLKGDKLLEVGIKNLPALAVAAVLIFPSLAFPSEISDFFYPVSLVIPILYYILFFILCYFAKNTSTKRFKILLAVFSIWFFISLVKGFTGF